MKKLLISIIMLISIICLDVNAKDTVFSLNKYKEEKWKLIIESYDDENSSDGFLVAGEVLKDVIEKENNTYDDTQVLLVKYNKKGKIKWKREYGNTGKDKVYSINYTYQDDKINGYIAVVDKSYEFDSEENIIHPVILYLDLAGNIINEKELIIDSPINKIIDLKDSYLIQTTNKLIKLDRDFNIILEHEFREENKTITIDDITPIKDNDSIVGYSLIKTTTIDNNKEVKLIRVNNNFEGEKEVNNSLSKYSNIHLLQTNNGYILYGVTSDVKIPNGDYTYFILNYDLNDQDTWETVGDISVKKDKTISLFPIKDKDEIKEYFLMYSSNNNKEIVKIGNDGTIKEKIKKINEDYYNIESFYVKNNTIYIIGQIICPVDDTCDYDSNSLFLISDEDKVVEIKEKDSDSILIISSIFIVLLVIGIIIKKKRRLRSS